MSRRVSIEEGYRASLNLELQLFSSAGIFSSDSQVEGVI